MKNKLIYALLSVFIALGLWFYVITVVSPESEQTYYDIQVTLDQKALNSKGLMFTNQEKPTVPLRLKGNRSDLNKLKSSDILLSPNLSKINKTGQQTLEFDISFPGSFADNAFEVLSYSPERIVLNVVDWESKVVDVWVEFTGNNPEYKAYTEEYTLDEKQKTVTISGPKSVISQIDYARAVVDLTNLTASIEDVPYDLEFVSSKTDKLDLTYVTASITQVTPKVKIQRAKDLQLVLNVNYDKTATTENTTITFSQEIIKVSGSEASLEALGDTLLLGNVDTAELLTDATVEYQIKLPEGIDNLSGLDTVTVTISFQGLETKVVHVKDIVPQNIPEGMEANVITKMKNVTLRGPKELIDRIAAEDVQLQVNLEGASAGVISYKPEVYIANPEFAAVGAIGDVLIDVELKEQTEPAMIDTNN